jgi:peptide/nickel transport system permease protein
VSAGGLALPGFILGILLILLFAVHLRMFPATGFTPITKGVGPNLRSLVLPATALGFPLACGFLRVLRGDLIDQLGDEDYITVARSKGVTNARLLTRHALRNSLFSLITIVGLNLGVLMGGTVLIEEIFGIPGMGQALISAIQLQDVLVVEAIVVVLSASVVVTSLLTDIVYAALDPRVRHGR